MKTRICRMHCAKFIVLISVTVVVILLGYWFTARRTKQKTIDLFKNQKAFDEARRKYIEKDKYNRQIIRVDLKEQERPGKTHNEKLNVFHGVHAKIISEGLNRHPSKLRKPEKPPDQHSNLKAVLEGNEVLDKPDSLVGGGHFLFQRGKKLLPQKTTKNPLFDKFNQRQIALQKQVEKNRLVPKNDIGSQYKVFDVNGNPVVGADKHGLPIIRREDKVKDKISLEDDNIIAYKGVGKKPKLKLGDGSFYSDKSLLDPVISDSNMRKHRKNKNENYKVNERLRKQKNQDSIPGKKVDAKFGKPHLQNENRFVDKNGYVWIRQSSQGNMWFKNNDDFITKTIEELHRGSYVVVNGGKELTVDGDRLSKMKYAEFGDPINYIFSSTSLPKNPRFMPNVGNGHIGTVVGGNAIFMNGVYNGRLGESHRARIPSMLAINITYIHPPKPYQKFYSLNTAQGIFTETTRGYDFVIEQRTYAHRHYTKLLVHEIDVMTLQQQELRLSLNVRDGHISHDITFQGSERPSWHLKHAMYMSGEIHNTEIEGMDRTKVHIVHDIVSDEIIMYKNKTRMKFVFLASLSQDEEDCISMYRQGQELLANNDVLMKQHVLAWFDLWNTGRITLDGNLQLSQGIFSSYYNLLSALPVKDDEQWPYVGLSPTGLAYGDTAKDYLGHVFWDQEIWMFPNILLLYPEIAKILLKGRLRRHRAALENAKINGNHGAQFPWESALTGVEVTPDAKYGKDEIHITGDISLAIRQYIFFTRDVQFLTNGGKSLVADIATFWMKRSVYKPATKLREILDVMPPDEHHNHVDNSAYTNVVAQISLENPYALTVAAGISKLNNDYHRAWLNYAKQMYVPFDEEEQYHPEFDGYKMNMPIKQADGILLGYPLMYNMTPSIRHNDLTIYEKVIEASGPAMTWSMFAIGWLEIKSRDKAWQVFKRQFMNIHEPFQVWTETSTGGGAANFITGAGGFLQAVTFGYVGLRIYDDRLDFDPVFPPKVNQMNVTGIKYLGASFNFIIKQKTIDIVLKSLQPNSPKFMVKVYSTMVVKYPHINEAVVIGRERATLMPINDRKRYQPKTKNKFL
ncbi:protein-glucosylgalactosylhydroxylysine glucosidase-like [Tubulanus polymorphus]|uniref:protein-glucosylgalactosylhydroxylysine glucosidase-like n=1 Tax=Tubulanus polymorphus TaxID=672921 RepID=UPI003DA2182C